MVERTFGRLVGNRRLARDYERLTATSEAMIKVAMIRLMATRLAGRTVRWANATEREALTGSGYLALAVALTLTLLLMLVTDDADGSAPVPPAGLRAMVAPPAAAVAGGVGGTVLFLVVSSIVGPLFGGVDAVDYSETLRAQIGWSGFGVVLTACVVTGVVVGIGLSRRSPSG